jgi:hypothetical protein
VNDSELQRIDIQPERFFTLLSKSYLPGQEVMGLITGPFVIRLILLRAIKQLYQYAILPIINKEMKE